MEINQGQVALECETVAFPKVQPDVQLVHEFTTTQSGVFVFQRKVFHFAAAKKEKNGLLNVGSS